MASTSNTLGRSEEAVAYYDQLLAANSSDPEALQGKSQALVNLGRYEEAVACFDPLLELEPENIEALEGRAFALARITSYNVCYTKLLRWA